jgi:hypothetical protein
MVAMAWLESAAAGDNSNQDRSAVPGTVYSVGKSGSSLKWLPQRPVADKAVKPVQYAAPADAPKAEPAAPSRNPSNAPFGDPFGDKKKSPAPAPAEKLGEEASPTIPAEPKISTEPKIPAEPAPLKETPFTQSKKTESVLPEIDQEKKLKSLQQDIREVCPSPKDMKDIKDLTTNILPPEGDLPHDCPLGNEVFQQRQFSPITYTWTASGLCHKPLYFEDVQLERYGHMAGPWVQPLASGAHFFATIPILPYKMGLEPPNECMYTLGYYRPGNCAPYLFDPLPLSVRGALFEAGGWIGGCFLFP